MNIKKIEIYSKSGKFDRTIQKARVYYEDGHDVKLDNIEDITMELAKFLQQEKMEIDDLINDKEKLPIIKYEELDILNPKAETKTKEEPKTKAPASKDAPKAEEEEKEKKKSWFSKLKKPLVCLGTVIVLTFVGSNLFQKGNDYSSKRTGTPKKTITQEFKDLPIKDIDTSDKYVSVGNDYYVKLDEFKNRTQKTELYKNVQAYLNGSNKTEDNLYWILSGISDNCSNIIHQMNEFADGYGITGDIAPLNLSDMFEDDDINYAVTDYFQDMCKDIRNNIVEGNREKVISAYRNFYNAFIDFVYCDVPITVNGRNIRYYDSEINGLARDYIMVMGQLLMEANINDYSAMIGRSVYKLDELRTFVSSTYVNLVEILYESVSKTR